MFARNQMEPKDIICLYSGVCRYEISHEHEENDYIVKVKSVTTDSSDCYIDGSHVFNYSGRYANYHTSPNARLIIPIGGLIICRHERRKAILVECTKPIEKGEEIFIDYDDY